MIRMEHVLTDPTAGTERRALILNFETPVQWLPKADVKQLFDETGSGLSLLENSNRVQVLALHVALSTVGGLTPHFLDGLCTFLRNHPFAISDNRTQERPLGLKICLSEYFDTDRPEGLIVEATSRICRAFCENERVRASPMFLDLPATPSMELLESLSLEPTSTARHINLRVSDAPGYPGVDFDVVQVLLGNGYGFGAVGASHVAALVTRLLESTRVPTQTPVLKLAMHSPRAAAAVAASLSSRRDHSHKCLALVAGDRRRLGQVVGAGTAAHPTLDGADLCVAVLRCLSVTRLTFEGFHFSSATVAAVQRALRAAPGATSAAAVSGIMLSNCTFVDNAAKSGDRKGSDQSLGICDFVVAMSRSDTLTDLSLMGTRLDLSDVKALCGMLTSSEWSLLKVHLGGTTYGGEQCLRGDGVLYFFKQLPNMSKLKHLTFLYAPLAFMSQAIVDGIKNNYSFESLEGLKVQCDDLALAVRVSSEITVYLRANECGRGIVSKAVADLENRQLQERALDVLHRLSNSKRKADDTTRYLCLQLLLPAYARRIVDRTPISTPIEMTYSIMTPSGPRRISERELSLFLPLPSLFDGDGEL